VKASTGVEGAGATPESTLVQQKGDVNTNIPQAVLDLEKKTKKVEKLPKENALL